MSNQLTVIEQTFKDPKFQNEIALRANLDTRKEDEQREAMSYMASALAEIQKSEGSEYGDLTKCHPDSLKSAVLDAATFKIKLDGRKLAHMESRWDKNRKCQVASLMIDTNGYIAKINEAYPDATFDITTVYDGDKIKITGSENAKHMEYECNDPFASVDKIKGFAVVIKYTTPKGGKVCDVHLVSKSDMDNIAAMGKGHAWKKFPLERMKTAALKRACKWHFRKGTISGVVHQMFDYDNKENFEIENKASHTRSTIVDNINRAIEKKSAPEQSEPESEESDEVIEAEVEEVIENSPENQPEPTDERDLFEEGESASGGGWHTYLEWVQSLTDDQKDIVRENHPAWQEKARQVTKSELDNKEPAEKDQPAL